MPSKKLHLQLYADECFPIPSVTYLKSLGYSVIHAFDKKKVNTKDQIHLSYSKKLKRVLITLDRDFIYYKEANLNSHPGVIVISVNTSTPLQVNAVCTKLMKNLSDTMLKDSILIVTSDKLIKIKNGKKVFEKDY